MLLVEQYARRCHNNRHATDSYGLKAEYPVTFGIERLDFVTRYSVAGRALSVLWGAFGSGQ